jgi:hypothetical protein
VRSPQKRGQAKFQNARLQTVWANLDNEKNQLPQNDSFQQNNQIRGTKEPKVAGKTKSCGKNLDSPAEKPRLLPYKKMRKNQHPLKNQIRGTKITKSCENNSDSPRRNPDCFPYKKLRRVTITLGSETTYLFFQNNDSQIPKMGAMTTNTSDFMKLIIITGMNHRSFHTSFWGVK